MVTSLTCICTKRVLKCNDTHGQGSRSSAVFSEGEGINGFHHVQCDRACQQQRGRDETSSTKKKNCAAQVSRRKWRNVTFRVKKALSFVSALCSRPSILFRQYAKYCFNFPIQSLLKWALFILLYHYVLLFKS